MEKFNNLSEKEIETIINLRKERKTYEEINNETNIPISKIKIVVRNNGLIEYRNYGKVAENIINQIQPLYNEIGNIKKVAKKLGIAYETARQYVILKDKTKLKPEELKKNKSKNVINWRKRKKLELIEYKGGECEICGYKKSTWALEFHHKDPNEKDFGISGKSWSFERLKKEVDKCILVCSNCHQEIHEELSKDK